jgi:hypothetical protein
MLTFFDLFSFLWAKRIQFLMSATELEICEANADFILAVRKMLLCDMRRNPNS